MLVSASREVVKLQPAMYTDQNVIGTTAVLLALAVIFTATGHASITIANMTGKTECTAWG
jgi:hypothetical protein